MLAQADQAAALVVAAQLCRRFEGLYLKPYLCPAGVPTIGYGSTRYLDGARVALTDQAITKTHADMLLRETLERDYLPGVLLACPGLETSNQAGAIVSFAYNLGLGALRASTLRRKINQGAFSEVPSQLRRWNKAGGRVLRGLVLRREAEAALFAGG